ncbi:MAG: ABC transporter ATP-binding protein [Chloroflexi bacterium]|nr:ABC transporter ATP-binding protein [Chloroflexota bacterium]
MNRSPTAERAVRADGLVCTFGATTVIADLTLDVIAGELFAILGPSGCGKTTALRLLAGFERPSAGRLTLLRDLVAAPSVHVPPERRGIGMVFQDYALFPHMSVGENVAYGVPVPGDRRGRVAEVLTLTGLSGFADRRVHELSGGEQQRVALARALAPRPRLLLLDEPFSNLDPTLRARVRGELREIVKRAGTTAILVTHDQEEALSIADRVAFMWRGRIEQVGTPDEIYRLPATIHAAEFIGDANLFRARADGGCVATPFGEYPAPAGADRVAIVVRPEDVELRPDGVPGRLVAREYYGHDQVLHVRLVGGALVRVRAGPRLHAQGTEVALALRAAPVVLVDDGDAEGAGAG